MVTDHDIETAINASTRETEGAVVYKLKEMKYEEHVESLGIKKPFNVNGIYEPILESLIECLTYYSSEIGTLSKIKERCRDDNAIRQYCDYFMRMDVLEIEDLEAEIADTRKKLV